jgi:hypothetical protein
VSASGGGAPAPKKRRKPPPQPALTEGAVHALFVEFDVNRDGRIDEDEMRDLAFAAGLALEPTDVQECIRALDADGDGAIDEAEFARWLVQQDGDGKRRVTDATVELRARLVARRLGRVLTKRANQATASLLLSDDGGDDTDVAHGLRAKTASHKLKSREESEKIRACLDRVGFLDSVSPAKKEQLVRAFQSRHFSAGQAIIEQGKVGNAFYVVQRGTCKVLVSTQSNAASDRSSGTFLSFSLSLISLISLPDFSHFDATGSESSAEHPEQKELRLLRAGAHFGEIALLNHTLRSATVEVRPGSAYQPLGLSPCS